MLLPGIWTSFTAYRLISRHIDRIFRIRFVLVWRPELTAFLTGLPRTRVAINVVGIAQTKAFVLNLTAPAPSKRQKGRIAAYPLLATRRLHQRRRWIATKAAMFTGNGLGFHPIVSHPVPLSDGVHMAAARRARFAGASRRCSLYPLGPCSSSRVITRRPRRRVLTREHVMSQLSKVRQSRNQWKHKATQRADQDRYRRKQLARVQHERDHANKALKEAQARLRQLEGQSQGLAVQHKVDLVW